METEATRYVRWIHFGGCVHNALYNAGNLAHITGVYATPQIISIPRRCIASLIADWHFLQEHKFAADELDLNDRMFLEYWAPEPDLWNRADIIFTNLVLDILYHVNPELGHGPKPSGMTDWSRVIHSFPFEPGPALHKFLRMRRTEPKDIIQAWLEFGRRVATPVVFLLFCTRNTMPNNYPEATYRHLLDIQTALLETSCELKDRWYFYDVDELLECRPKYYKDRHHLSPEGLSRLRDELTRRMMSDGLIERLGAGKVLDFTDVGLPDRLDFAAVGDNYLRALTRYHRRLLLAGHSHIHKHVSETLEQWNTTAPHPFLQEDTPQETDGAALLWMRWGQFTSRNQTLERLSKSPHTDYIELVAQWREPAVIPADELDLRRTIRKRTEDWANATLNVTPDRPFERYVARTLYPAYIPASTHAVLTPNVLHLVRAASKTTDLEEKSIAAFADLEPRFHTLEKPFLFCQISQGLS